MMSTSSVTSGRCCAGTAQTRPSRKMSTSKERILDTTQFIARELCGPNCNVSERSRQSLCVTRDCPAPLVCGEHTEKVFHDVFLAAWCDFVNICSTCSRSDPRSNPKLH